MTKSELKDIIYECLYESVDENVKDKASKVENIKGIATLGLLSGATLFLIIKNIKSKREEAKRRKEAERNSKKQKEEKEARDKYWNSEEGKAKYKELKNEVEKLGKSVGLEVAKQLKIYNKKELYPIYHGDHNYDTCIDIRYEPINDYDVVISDYQCGVDTDYILKWEKNHPNYENDPELKKEYDKLWNNKAYYILLDEGTKIAKQVFKDMEHSKEISMYTNTGDGDEGCVYIWYIIS